MSRTILIVDDDRAQQRLLEKSLSAEGFAVQSAKDGLEALSRIDQVRPDVILADAIMPRLDGMTFLRAVKGRPETRAIPVIMMTAMDDPQFMMQATNLGAYSFLSKPFAIEDLLSKVRRAVRSLEQQASE